MSWTLPSSFPALSSSCGWFLPFTVSHFDLPGPKYAVAKAQNDNFDDGSCTVWPATRPKSVKMVKTFFPLEPSPRWLAYGQIKIYILSTLAKVMGVQSSTYQKTSQKYQISGKIWGYAHILARYTAKNGRNPNFFPLNHDFAGLMMGSQKLKLWSFWPKL